MSGHGWVTPNPDGSKARCGGPAICGACAREKATGEAAIAARLNDASSGKQTGGTTPEEIIRRAAALMRERAQAVQHFTSPWRTAGPDEDDQWRVMYATDHPAAGLIATTADYGTYCVPDHIASWHPLVALAVARWLESLKGIEWKETGPAAEELTHALAIARAYLGEVPA